MKPWQGREAKWKGDPFKTQKKVTGEKPVACNCSMCRSISSDGDFIPSSTVYPAAHQPYKFQAGDVIIPSTPEAKKEWGSAMLIVYEIHEERSSQPWPWMEPTKYDGTAYLISDNRPDCPKGRFHSVHFKKISEAAWKQKLDAAKEGVDLLKKDPYKTGDSVQLTEDIEVFQRGRFNCGYVTVRKGTPAIVDLAPGAEEDKDDFADKRARDRNAPKNLSFSTNFGVFTLEQLILPRVGVFLPEMEEFTWVSPKQITRKTPELKDTKLIVPDGYMERLITATKRVTNVDIHEKVYEQLGLNRVCQKGRGAIALLYGPPGTGKTLTAEIMAERISRPIIKLTLGSLTDGEGLAQRLATGFQRAKRYNAVLLLDEVDVFIRKRGGANPIFDENTSVFLRVLEYFDGILIMTTNLVDHIDPAIFSRVHVCLEYGSVTPDERKAIWKSMFPEELKAVLAGGEDAHEKMFDELSTVKINGREIKNVIQNVVCRAVVATETANKKGLEAIPQGTKWISPKSFVDEARALEDQRNQLKGGPDAGGMF